MLFFLFNKNHARYVVLLPYEVKEELSFEAFGV